MPPTNTQQKLDPQVVALTKAIREAEGFKGDWNIKGQSGEWGAYQFTPATWDAYSKEFGINAPFGAATPQQQNEVAYKKVKQWKDAGYNPGEIASMWNAGAGKPNAYLEDHKGVNKMGVAYDTPAYATKVAQAYQRLKGQHNIASQQQDVPMQPFEKGFWGDVGDTLAESGTKLANVIGRTASGEINPLSGLIQGGGAIASGLTGLTGDVLENIPLVGDAVKGLEEAIGKGVGAVAETEQGQKAIQSYMAFAEKHPELAGNISAAFDIATAIPVAKGLIAVKKGVGAGANRILRGSKDDILEAVSPNLTPKEMAQAVATRGTQKKGLLGEVSVKPDPFDVKVADAVKATVPGFKPNKPLLENVAAVQTTVDNMKKQLKQAVQVAGQDRIYSFKELAATLNSIDRPLMIASDVSLNNAYNRVVAKALEIAKKKGGKVSNLLDARQEFDFYIKKQFPNLYSSDTLTPMRQAVKDIRNAMTDFTAKALPPDVGLRESLLVQHQLITAIENMAEKATKGAGREIGTTAIDRSPGMRRTRGLIRTGTQAALQGAGIGGVMKVLD